MKVLFINNLTMRLKPALIMNMAVFMLKDRMMAVKHTIKKKNSGSRRKLLLECLTDVFYLETTVIGMRMKRYIVLCLIK